MFLHPISATFIVSFADTPAVDALPTSELIAIPAASAEEYFIKDLLLTIIVKKFNIRLPKIQQNPHIV
jgi:hypothetical protein